MDELEARLGDLSDPHDRWSISMMEVGAQGLDDLACTMWTIYQIIFLAFFDPLLVSWNLTDRYLCGHAAPFQHARR